VDGQRRSSMRNGVPRWPGAVALLLIGIAATNAAGPQPTNAMSPVPSVWFVVLTDESMTSPFGCAAGRTTIQSV
jgi:hypothetical protein